MSVYIQLFHGRSSTAEDMQDWGTPGPWLGPFDAVQITYASHLKMGYAGDVFRELCVVEDCLYYGGVFYGDWIIQHDIPENVEPSPYEEEKAQLPRGVMKKSERQSPSYGELKAALGNLYYLCAFDDDTPQEDLVAMLEQVREVAQIALYKPELENLSRRLEHGKS